jgi:hypothetical protein
MADLSDKDISEALGVNDPRPETGSAQYRVIDISGNSETWDWRKTPVFEGAFIGSHPATTRFGVKTVFDVEDKAHKKWAIWSSAQLQRGFSQCNVGDQIKITYKGRETTKGGQPLNVFVFEAV